MRSNLWKNENERKREREREWSTWEWYPHLPTQKQQHTTICFIQFYPHSLALLNTHTHTHTLSLSPLTILLPLFSISLLVCVWVCASHFKTETKNSSFASVHITNKFWWDQQQRRISQKNFFHQLQPCENWFSYYQNCKIFLWSFLLVGLHHT